MSYDGASFGNRVDHFTYQKIAAKVVDNIMTSPTLVSRFMGNAKPFVGKTMDYVVDITRDTQGQWFNGLETLDAASTNTTINLSYARTHFEQPVVKILVESFANSGAQQAIPLDTFKYEKAASETLQSLGTAFYATTATNVMNGLTSIVLDSGTIGGQSRTTYSALNAYVLASGGTLTLAKLAQCVDNASAAGLQKEKPTIMASNKTVWSFYEQLLAPTVRNAYSVTGPSMMTTRGTRASMNEAKGMGQGFEYLEYRGIPWVKDDFATAQTIYFLNENYLWMAGSTEVPEDWKGFLSKVSLGTTKAYDGTGAEALDLPSEYNGMFYQKELVMPSQAGMISRFYFVGQMITTQPRRLAKLTGVTGV